MERSLGKTGETKGGGAGIWWDGFEKGWRLRHEAESWAETFHGYLPLLEKTPIFNSITEDCIRAAHDNLLPCSSSVASIC